MNHLEDIGSNIEFGLKRGKFVKSYAKLAQICAKCARKCAKVRAFARKLRESARNLRENRARNRAKARSFRALSRKMREKSRKMRETLREKSRKTLRAFLARAMRAIFAQFFAQFSCTSRNFSRKQLTRQTSTAGRSGHRQEEISDGRRGRCVRDFVGAFWRILWERAM